jgi:sulfonate transport system permease protein
MIMARLRSLATGLLPLLLLLFLWHLASRTGLFPPQVLVPPQEVASTLVTLAQNGELQSHLGVSLKRLLLGFVAGAAAGLSFGTAIALSRWLETAFAPLFQALRQVPVLAFLPMLVLLLGIEEQFKIVVVAVAAFFPIALAAFDGVRGVPRSYIEVARIFRTPILPLLRGILLPAALPPVLTGLRLGLTRAWLVLVACELLAADSGIGQMMEMGRQMFRIDVVLVGVLVSGLVGYLLDRTVKLIERRTFRWKEA